MDTATLSSGEMDASVTQPPSDPFAELQRLAQVLLAEVRLVSEARFGAAGRAHPRYGPRTSLRAASAQPPPD
jgi:hypothetical protein